MANGICYQHLSGIKDGLPQLKNNNKIKLCQAVRKEKDIKCLLTSVRKDYVKTDIRRRNRFHLETLVDQLTSYITRSKFLYIRSYS